MSANVEAFQSELSRARKFIRGNVLRGCATFCCENPRCSTGLVRISFCEERGSLALPFQWPLRCPRCTQAFEKYIGIDLSR
jgi:hypothetical protein